jgi:putative addiction module component (TIGR02574 family)
MNSTLKQLPVDERIRLVEDLWDSIAVDQSAIPLSSEQMEELDRRLDAYEADSTPGKPAKEVISKLRSRL